MLIAYLTKCWATSRNPLTSKSKQGNGTRVADGGLHNVAVVVSQTKMSFYTDAKLQMEVNLKRPVTDCTGSALEIGGMGVPSLGAITFFPRQLTQLEMEEIMFLGHTSEAVASGRIAFEPEKTTLDEIGAKQTTAFERARGDRSEAASILAVESALTRLIVQSESEKLRATNQNVPMLDVPAIPGLSVANHPLL